MHEQAGLGNKKIHRMPTYTETQIGRVTSANDFKKYGRIEVIFLDYGQPFPVWVSGDIDREPVSGDQVLVGFIQGRQDNPYMLGYVRNEAYTSNFILVEKDKITLQLPTDPEDIKGHLLDDSKKDSRVIIEILTSGVSITCSAGVTIKGGTTGVSIDGGTQGVARIGDTVQVTVPTHGTCTGTITSGSALTKA